jgi:hypothetical protein
MGFGAVDYIAEVWVNDAQVGTHEGGYLPFEFDITEALRPGDNALTLRVADPPELFAEIPHGKQSWYGPISGPWQSVWIEHRPATHLLDIRVTPGAEWVDVAVTLSRPLLPGQALAYSVLDPAGRMVAQVSTTTLTQRLKVPSPALWDLDSPNLYSLRLGLSGGGQPEDTLSTEFGFRTISTEGGRLLLNGRPIYLRAALDQDYYPDLIYTPPSTEYLEAQFRQAKAMGLNCLRLHIKVGDPRYYAAADRLGLLIWTELPNWQRLTPAAAERARATLEGMVARDWNHPSIIIWTIINECWGLDLTQADHRAWLAEAYAWLKALDPHRLVVGNSACWGNFHVATDVEDFHYYCALPDRHLAWRAWVNNFAGRPNWTFARTYTGAKAWRAFLKDPWNSPAGETAAEVRRRGDEPLIVSEFGTWGLPDLELLRAGYGGQDPWWFETGLEWNSGVVYPHGVEARYRAFHFERAFRTLSALTRAHQAMQLEALKYQIEQMRLHATVQGYVITELTDVHWESNGLLDMHRNPKLAAAALPAFNADDVLVPDWNKLAFWPGETIELPVVLSHYGHASLAGSRLEWSLEGFPGLGGVIESPAPPQYTASLAGTVRFAAPEVERPVEARLRLRLLAPDGSLASSTDQAVYFFPRPAAPGPGAPRLYSDQCAEALRMLGYSIVETLAEADVAVVTMLTDDLREYIQRGGQVLWLAESESALQTYLPDLEVVARRGTTWEGNWASTFSWINQDRMFGSLPTGGRVNFAFAGLTPEHVLSGYRPADFARAVHAGLTVGWLHKTTALIAERHHGHGRLLSSTFRLSDHLGTHPIATCMVMDMIAALTRRD